MTYLAEKPAQTGLFVTAILLAALLMPQLSGGPDQARIELAAVPSRPVPLVSPEAQPPAPAAQPIPPAAPSGPPVDLSAVVLRGVMGGGPGGGAAIFDGAGATQRVVRIGREIVPGVLLRSVGIRHAIGSSTAGDVRLELGRSGGAPMQSSASNAASATGSGRPTGSETAQRETMQFRLGLEPVKSDGRFSGYAVRPGAQLPYLGAAGIQAGDLILSVNGSRLDEERLMELSWQIANSSSTEVEFSRGGKRYRKQLGSASN